jgi:hypothetical protein
LTILTIFTILPVFGIISTHLTILGGL